MTEQILLIDGSSLIHRAFYALPLLTSADGLYTNGVYGFLTMYEQLMEQFDPAYVLVAFDRSEPTFRHKTYAQYKANRDKSPTELAQQFGLLKEVLQAMRVPQIDLDGFEADDILGTMANAANREGVEAVLVTGDRDYLQLINDQTRVYLTKKGISEMEMFDAAHLEEVYGVTPRQMIDVKGLMGDSSDNIPGIPGVGEKKALGYIQQYGSIEGLYENIDEVRGPKTQETIRAHEQQAYLSRTLGEIHCDVPMDTDLERYQREPVDEEATAEWFERLGFRSLLAKRRGGVTAEAAEAAKVLPPDEAVKQFPAEGLVPYRLYFSEENYTKADPTALAFGTDEGIVLTRWEDAKDGNKVLSAFFAVERGTRVTFDVKESLYALGAAGIEPAGRTDDLMLIAYLLDPGQSNESLLRLAKKYADRTLTDPEQWQGKGKKKIPAGLLETDALAQMAGEEVTALAQIYEPMKKELTDLSMLPLYESVELPLAAVLADMERTGFPVDTDTLDALGERFSDTLEELSERIYEAAGETFNINSTKQLGKVLFETLNLPVIKKTKTGFSTDNEVLETLSGKHPIIEDILQYRQLQKLVSTYIDGLTASVREDGRIHTTFRQNIAATGRISSTDPNIQNIPVRSEEGRQIRRAFVASPGRRLLDADYSQIELRILAHLAQDEAMLNAFREGADIHTKTAAEVFHKADEEVTPLERSRAKAVNFGIVYGISDYGLSRDLKIPRAEAKEYIERYLATYPSIRAYMESIVEEAKENGFVETTLHRRRYIPELTSRNFNIRSFGERIALNMPIQGSAADIIKVAMVGVADALKKRKLDTQLLLQVHDELILDVAPGEEEEVAELVKEVMQSAAELRVPLTVDVAFGESWYDAK